MACDALGDEDGALGTLEALAGRTYFTLKHHFRLAGRRLSRDEPELAWKVLDQAVADDIGPGRGRQKATRRGVYDGFTAWLEEIGHGDLAAQAKEQVAGEPRAAWGEGPSTKSWGHTDD